MTEVWYSRSTDWQQLESTTGSRLIYRLRQAP